MGLLENYFYHGLQRQCLITIKDFKKANELYEFYTRFDNKVFIRECEVILQTVSCETEARLIVFPQDVTSVFRKICTKKSTGPNGISAYLLRVCAEELTPAWCPIFRQSLENYMVPLLWKKTIITLVPKKSCYRAIDNNDIRLVALTSIVRSA